MLHGLTMVDDFACLELNRLVVTAGVSFEKESGACGRSFVDKSLCALRGSGIPL